MSLNLWHIKTPNLNFCLPSSKTQVHQFKKDVSNSATEDSMMNAHKKIQLTYVSINCSLIGLSCDLPKILKFTILASDVSSSSTGVLKFPHTKNDFIFTRYSSTIYIAPKSQTTLALKKMNIRKDFTYRFALIF